MGLLVCTVHALTWCPFYAYIYANIHTDAHAHTQTTMHVHMQDETSITSYPGTAEIHLTSSSPSPSSSMNGYKILLYDDQDESWPAGTSMRSNVQVHLHPHLHLHLPSRAYIYSMMSAYTDMDAPNCRMHRIHAYTYMNNPIRTRVHIHIHIHTVYKNDDISCADAISKAKGSSDVKWDAYGNFHTLKWITQHIRPRFW